MGKFVATPEVISKIGGEINSVGDQFMRNLNTIYASISEMVRSDYLSPEAKKMASEIESHKEELINMGRTINTYGNFCLTTSNNVVNSQEEISDSFKVGDYDE